MINRDVLEKAMKDRGLTSGCGVEMEYVGPKYGKIKSIIGIMRIFLSYLLVLNVFHLW